MISYDLKLISYTGIAGHCLVLHYQQVYKQRYIELHCCFTVVKTPVGAFPEFPGMTVDIDRY